MINIFRIRKLAALILSGFLPSLAFVIVLRYNGILWAAVCWLFALIFSLLIGVKLLNNPFSNMLEGKGLLAANLDSTGVLAFFNVAFDKGLLRGRFRNSEVSEAFDRDATASMSPAIKAAGKATKTKDGGITFSISGKELADARFAFNQYPLVIYNEVAETFFSKSYISGIEKTQLAYNKITYLGKKTERLADSMVNFGRYVVDNLKPKPSAFGGLPSWVIVIVGVLVVGLIIFLIMRSAGAGGALSAAGEGAKSAVQAMTGGAPVTPAG